jgi:hypothetical protein
MPPPSSHPVAAAPRAISAEWWETVCPPHKRHVISSKDAPNNVEGDVLIKWWVCTLGEVSDGCMEVDLSSQVIFDCL